MDTLRGNSSKPELENLGNSPLLLPGTDVLFKKQFSIFDKNYIIFFQKRTYRFL